MYGHFNLIIRSFILERQGGENVWTKICAQVKCASDFDEYYVYDEDITGKLIKSAIAILGLPEDPFLEMLGEYYLSYLRKKGHDEMLRNLGSNVLEFLQNLDSVHSFSKRDHPDMVAPSFRCDEDSAADRMVLHYYSARKGLHCVIKGFAKEASKAFFNMQLEMEVLSIVTEKVAEYKGSREHVTFNIIAKKIQEKQPEDGPPTFIAQTKKNSERQILKDDVEAVKLKLEQIRAELGEGGLPLMKKKTPKAKWRALAKISVLHRGFVPNYPESLAINPRMFIEVFPFHLIFDKEMKIYQSGIRIQMLMPTIRYRQALLKDFFAIRYPNCVDLTYENIGHFVLCPFVLELKRDKMAREWHDRPPLELKGQMFFLRDRGYYLYMASPSAYNWSDLEERKMKLADVPMWDVTRDFIVSDMHYRQKLEHNIRQSLSGGSADRTSIGGVGGVGGRRVSDGGLKAQLQLVQQDLDNEREKNAALYQTFLPREIVDLTQTGQVPSGEAYEDVTALFCDVVSFLPMVAKCSPNDVVGILNELQIRFDKVTRAHQTYKVESIGDAFFVVAGVGEDKVSHAEKIANTALGLRLSALETHSPLDNSSIEVRIGVHTGSVITGVIGHRIPRFVVLGETAVVASRMESHGEAGKIHVSPTTFRQLKNKGFTLQDRGKIELRGFGVLDTYFLLRNDHMTDAQLVGTVGTGNQDVAYINEGKVDTAFGKNKVHPVDSPSSGVGSRPATGESELALVQYK